MRAAVDPQTGTGTPYPTFTFTPTAPPAPTDDLTPTGPPAARQRAGRAKALLAAAKAQLAEQPRHGSDTPAS